MARISNQYQPGYQGSAVLNGNTYFVPGWSSDDDPGLWDTTNFTTGGWMAQAPSIRKVSFSFDVIAAIPVAANSGATPPVPATYAVPDFKAGDTIPVTFTINGTDAYVGNVIVNKVSVKVDIKAGVTFSISADSQGPMTGTLAITPAGQ